MNKTRSGYLARIIKQLSTVVIATVILAISAPTVRAGEGVDLLLVLSADVCYSIAGEQSKLQREGYAQALTKRRLELALGILPAGDHLAFFSIFLLMPCA